MLLDCWIIGMKLSTQLTVVSHILLVCVSVLYVHVCIYIYVPRDTGFVYRHPGVF